jgi:putative CocE/NonD family hydrolase
MALLDHLASRVLGLPGPVRNFWIERGLRIPMRDGVTLAADHYVPAGEPAGTLLVRGPYGRRFPFNQLYARPYAARGYHVVFVSSRGTAASEGDFDPMRTERDDGRDVVAWLVAQPWFTGTFATIGPSYLGYVQWALLEDPPPQLAAAVVTVGPHDFARHSWGTGGLNLDLVGWSDMVSRLPRSDRPSLSAAIAQVFSGPARKRALQSVFTDLPLAEAGERHYAGRARWFRDRVTRPDLEDPYWAPMRHPLALDRAQIPILLHSGWQDLFLGQTLEQYSRLSARGVDVALTIGPWTHTEVIGKGASVLIPEALDWLGATLRGEPLRRRRRVRVKVTGSDGWREMDAWPPAATQRALYLRPGGGLDQTPAPGSASFTFDPASPTPAVGGPLLDGGGYVDDSALASRPDVLAFTGATLGAPLEIQGTPVVELAHHADNRYADIFVRVSEVSAHGSRNVTEGYRRLDPSRDQNAPLRLELLPAAHRFAAGSRIRVLIAGGCYPQFSRNLGTGENPGLGTTLAPSRHTIDLGPSRLLLPVTV